LIAVEKAGIIKPEIPVILGEPDDEILPVITQFARTTNSSLIVPMEPEFIPDSIFGYQRINYKTVYATIEILRQNGLTISDAHIQAGIQNLRQNTGFLGRLERVKTAPPTYLDVAHNPAGIKQTIESIRERLSGNLHIIYGTSSDKDILEIANELPSDAHYYVTTFGNPRSASLSQLSAVFRNRYENVHFFENPYEAYKKAELLANKSDTILITGSFFLISDFYDVFFA
jgi:dihydrofolate synthase/folylpolyglutamate synthase